MTTPKKIYEYTDEELHQAQAELDELTPEDWLHFQAERTQLLSAVENAPAGEALASLNMFLVTANGDEAQLTIRGWTGPAVIDAFAGTLKYAARRYGITPKSRQRSPAAMAPPPQAGTAQPQRVPVTDPTDPGATPDKFGRVPGQLVVEGLAKIKIEPLQGEQAKVHFYPSMRNGQPGRYATTNKDRHVADWMREFQHYATYVPTDGAVRLLGESDFSRGGEFEWHAGQVTAEYVVSENMKSTGAYYLNFVRLMPPKNQPGESQ